MEQNDKTSLLLDMHEHPENYSDEQLARLLDDEQMQALWQQLATAKRAMLDIPEPDVDTEWEEFEQYNLNRRSENLWLKVAAMFIGVLMLSAFTYAAIHAIRHAAIDKGKETTEKVVITTKTEAADEVPRLGVADTIAVEQDPVVFDNVSLETIINDIATRHQLQVEFRNEESRALRFYFVWQPDEDLDAVLERLNMFEQVNITREGDKIVAE